MKNFIITLISTLLLFFSLNNTFAFQKQNYTNKSDSSKIYDSGKTTLTDSIKNNQIHIDTNKSTIIVDTVQKNNPGLLDSLYNTIKEKKSLTNTKLFLYIFLSIVGLLLFFFLFVLTLFKIFHKTHSTRQSLLLSWNLFFVVSIIWVYIVWGILAGFWNSGAFLTVIIFLIIVSLIMLIIAIKSK